MNRDDIIRMARKAGIDATSDTLCRYEGWIEPLERFAALVAAAERQRMEIDSIHTCHAECQRPACAATRRAVAREREACAEMVAGMDVQHPKYIAAAIRARGEA
jgi:hypothetical protein